MKQTDIINLWEQVPSVSKGGKPYFLYNPIHRLWIVWNRVFRRYELKSERDSIGFFSTEIEAQTAVKFGYIRQ